MWIRSPRVIGRSRELDTLTRALRNARAGSGRAVFLLGEGGIGKSRLAMEITGEALACGARVLRGRGSTIGPMVPFRPLAEALVAVTRQADLIDPDELGPYLPALGVLVPDWRDRDGTDTGASLLVVAEAVLRLLAVLGRERGCVLVLDDLQDADAETLFILEYLVDNLATTSVLLVGAIRTGPSKAYDLVRSAARRQSGTILELGSLPRADVDQLAAACLDADPAGVDPDVADLVWRTSAGSPFIAEEVLHEWVDEGLLINDRGTWRMVGQVPARVPAALADTIAARADRLGPQGQTLLSTAAVVGHRFPLSVVQKVTGVDDRSLLGHLHAGISAQLISPDEAAPDWYVFRHPLTSEALLEALTPARRSALAVRVADAVEALHPGLPGEWCPLVATLRLTGGDPEAAGRLFTAAGKRALADAAVDSAVALLSKADELLAGNPGAPVYVETLDALVYALGEKGQYQQAFALATRFAGIGTRDQVTALHTKLAWVAYLGGRPHDGMDQVAIARAVHGPGPADEQLAALDAVHANLLLEVTGSDHLYTAEKLARNALAFAEQHGAPTIACQSLQVLGLVARERDLDEAARFLERAKAITEQHRLPLLRNHVLMRLGGHRQLTDGDSRGLQLAKQEAMRTGSITIVCTVDVVSALYLTLLGEFEEAAELVAANLAQASRLQLWDLVRYSHATRAILQAHQGNRRGMEDAIAEVREHGGTDSHEESLCLGLARAFCALLEEDVDRARRELAAAAAFEERNPTGFYLTGGHGIQLLLDVLSGDAGEADLAGLCAASRMRWNRQWVHLAEAVVHGRRGRVTAANTAVAAAVTAAEPYRMARHLGLRLVAEAATADGWGDPVTWMRQSEEYFHEADLPAVASACRALLRRNGAPVQPRRTGADRVPRRLRDSGITVREYEVFQLLVGRLGNKEIAKRLHISPKTVEKHVSSLMAKTSRHDRVSLTEYAATFEP
ncbi:helix-turn-helix transcriptional regulator [Actinosynnema sp. CS-041913]|uniref:helix-turn-helix transcriptional regulator n=1 Tax=Actinosynnema sp. CS-041913 TaxID=3239917 RepID=UPI003D89E0BB